MDGSHSKAETLVIQVFGANTDIGKTVISAGILKACLHAGIPPNAIRYIKPVQTGQVTDGEFMRQHIQEAIDCQTLFRWSTPISPHLAAIREKQMVTDEEVLNALTSSLTGLPPNAFALIETAGGVLSPCPSSAARTQADLYRPLRLPIVLIGDGRLGGISITTASYESLMSRGYDVYAIVMIDGQEDLGNASAVQTYLHEGLGHSHVPVLSLPALPKDSQSPLHPWYVQTQDDFAKVLSTIQASHERRRSRLKEMVHKAANMFWYPFTQHRGLVADQISIVDSAYGDYYTILDGESYDVPTRLVDGCASWWTQGMGHGRADMSLAIAQAAGRYGHIIFPGNVHEPSLRLAELMLQGPGKGWAKRVFFSDNGSTAMEIAVKMALKKAAEGDRHSGSSSSSTAVAVITQQDCYHGDTLGCMDAAAPTVFNTGQHPWYVPRTLSLTVPTIGWVQGQLVVEIPACPNTPSVQAQSIPFPDGMASLLDVISREKTDPLTSLYQQAVNAHMDAFESKPGAPKLGAILIEPVLMGAAGMILVDPLFQRILVQQGRKRGLPIVFDEVASGLYRLGCNCAAELLQISPDIACYGKTLTGGYLPMAVTLTTEEVFEAFQGPAKSDALLHGHSYTANPLACAASVRALETYQQMSRYRGGPLFAAFDEKEVAKLSLDKNVRRAVTLGTVLAIELEVGEGAGYGSLASAQIVQHLRKAGVYARPLGNVVYLLASQTSEPSTTMLIMEALKATLSLQGSSGATEDRPAAAVVI